MNHCVLLLLCALFCIRSAHANVMNMQEACAKGVVLCGTSYDELPPTCVVGLDVQDEEMTFPDLSVHANQDAPQAINTIEAACATGGVWCSTSYDDSPAPTTPSDVKDAEMAWTDLAKRMARIEAFLQEHDQYTWPWRPFNSPGKTGATDYAHAITHSLSILVFIFILRSALDWMFPAYTFV